jgi:ADP-heptose:LPS heptosyltransferase
VHQGSERLPLLRPSDAPSRRQGERIAVMHPGSGSARKNWPAERFAEVAQWLRSSSWTVRWLAGPADTDSLSLLRAALPRPPHVVQPPDVTSLASEISTADLYVGNDSGVTHLSGRLGVPTVAIFGPTRPETWGPRGPIVRAVAMRDGWAPVETVCQAIRELTGLPPVPSLPERGH